MIVYLESNFVFELGLGRGEHGYCSELLRWCETGRIELRLPACVIPEVRGALRKRNADRFNAIRALNAQREDANRHSVSASDAQTYRLAEEALRAAGDREAEQINSLIAGLYRVVKIVALDDDVLRNVELYRAVKVLHGEGDVVVFASIMRDLESRKRLGDTAPSMFITFDSDFRNTAFYLRPYSCDLLTSYSAAVARLKGQIA